VRLRRPLAGIGRLEAAIAMRRVVVVAMPCTEVVDVGGSLDIF
jgi:BarA-like signal transduction histidine kinase